MAIKSKQKEVSLPADLDALVTEAMTFSILEKNFADLGKDLRVSIKDYLKDPESEVVIEVGKSIDATNGKVLFTEKENVEWDTDAIAELVEKGVITLASLLNAVSFTKEKMKVVLGSSAAKVMKLKAPTEVLTLKANTDFKAKVNEEFGEKFGPEIKTSEPANHGKEEKSSPKSKAKGSAKATEPARAKKSKAKVASSEDDLDAILSE